MFAVCLLTGGEQTAACNWNWLFGSGKIHHGEPTKCKSRANSQLSHVPCGSVGKHLKWNSIGWMKCHCQKFHNGLWSASFLKSPFWPSKFDQLKRHLAIGRINFRWVNRLQEVCRGQLGMDYGQPHCRVHHFG